MFSWLMDVSTVTDSKPPMQLPDSETQWCEWQLVEWHLIVDIQQWLRQ